MREEIFSAEERKNAIETYGSFSDEVCYAMRRLRKIGATPYIGKYYGDKEDILRRAIQQARKTNKLVSIYLSGNGLFSISPQYGYEGWDNFVESAPKNRWDKPIEQQKKDEEFDRFRNYKYGLMIYKKWGVASDEGCYAAERLEKLGIKAYKGKISSDIEDTFKMVVDEATRINKKVAINLTSGILTGLFVISPLKEGETVEKRFDYFVENQKKLRWDKPVEQQKAEEKAIFDRLFNNIRK